MTTVNMEIQPSGHCCYTFCLRSVGVVSSGIKGLEVRWSQDFIQEFVICVCVCVCGCESVSIYVCEYVCELV